MTLPALSRVFVVVVGGVLAVRVGSVVDVGFCAAVLPGVVPGFPGVPGALPGVPGEVVRGVVSDRRAASEMGSAPRPSPTGIVAVSCWAAAASPEIAPLACASLTRPGQKRKASAPTIARTTTPTIRRRRRAFHPARRPPPITRAGACPDRGICEGKAIALPFR
ncbi:MAG: hypothetical protein EA380_05550 [Phycisphaeraceae bacterium]|nr:MAG: hypothetical protein EA380_05550 [Phycisphaeraceae bacterium]